MIPEYFAPLYEGSFSPKVINLVQTVVLTALPAIIHISNSSQNDVFTACVLQFSVLNFVLLPYKFLQTITLTNLPNIVEYEMHISVKCVVCRSYYGRYAKFRIRRTSVNVADVNDAFPPQMVVHRYRNKYVESFYPRELFYATLPYILD